MAFFSLFLPYLSGSPCYSVGGHSSENRHAERRGGVRPVLQEPEGLPPEEQCGARAQLERSVLSESFSILDSWSCSSWKARQ